MRELKNGFISEDKTDEMKHAKLSEIDKVLLVLNTKIKELSKLDTEGTGTGDLHDQLATYDKALKALQGVTARSHKIVPHDMKEAVGDSAEPIWDLIDELGSHSIVLENLIRYLDGDTIEDFVDDFRRHHDMPKRGEAEESVTEAEGTRTIEVNKNIDLAGDSIYQGEKRGEEVTYKTFVHEITINTDEDGYMSVTVKHEGPWTIYTDSGFEQEISGIIGTDVSFSEQGMQDDGMAHLEGDEPKQESKMEDLDRILKIAGLTKAPVAEEKVTEDCGCDCGKSPCEACGEDHHDIKETVEEETVEEAKKELDEEPNEGNEFAHELKKARDEGKDEFEVDGKKYKVKKESAETDEEVVAEAPTMDTTQLINLLRNAGLSEDKIEEKLNEWANSPADAGEPDPEVHGDPYDFAQMVNLSLKRYLDAEDLKINVNEDHSKEKMTEAYKNFKNK